MSDRELLKVDLAGTAPILESSTKSFLESIQGNIVKGRVLRSGENQRLSG